MMRTMINDKALEMVIGGAIVSGTRNYLALRKNPIYSRSQEIARLHNGDYVKVLQKGIHKNGYTYTKVYSPTLNLTGYVIAGYLK